MVQDEEYRKFIVHVMKLADFKLEDIIVKEQNAQTTTTTNKPVSAYEQEEVLALVYEPQPPYQLVFQYKNPETGALYELPLDLISDGTKRYLNLIPAIKISKYK
ncbi:MAG: hypothetical protein AAGI23_06260 [Bacteroidota bacterium]